MCSMNLLTLYLSRDQTRLQRHSSFLKCSCSTVQVSPWFNVYEIGSRKRKENWGLSLADCHNFFPTLSDSAWGKPADKVAHIFIQPTDLSPCLIPVSSCLFPVFLQFSYINYFFPALV